MAPWNVTTRSPEETRALGEQLGRLLDGPVTLLLDGDLGSGKTCFVQGLAAGLDVETSECVSSPTYSLMNQYPARIDLYHFDLYRLASADELHDVGLDDYLSGSGVAVVEWGGLLAAEQTDGLQVRFAYGDDEQQRVLEFVAVGSTGEVLLQQLQQTA